MFMPVMFTCLASGCFFWGGVVTETKEQCEAVIAKTTKSAEDDKEVKAYRGECIEVRFNYKDKRITYAD